MSNTTINVKNAGQGLILAGDTYLFPGQARRIPRHLYDRLKDRYPDLVPLDQAAPEPGEESEVSDGHQSDQPDQPPAERRPAKKRRTR